MDMAQWKFPSRILDLHFSVFVREPALPKTTRKLGFDPAAEGTLSGPRHD